MTTFRSAHAVPPDSATTSKQAIRKGIADDGGLFVSVDSPGETYGHRCPRRQVLPADRVDVLSVPLPDFYRGRIRRECITAAYGPQCPMRITPAKSLGDDFVMELFNGPTSAFKR